MTQESGAAPEQAVDDIERLVLGATPSYTREQITDAAGLPDDVIRQLWRALGFPDVVHQKAFTEQDLAALTIVRDLMDRDLLDADAAVQLARSLGQTTARLAEWQVEALGRRLVEQFHLQGRVLESDPEAMGLIREETEAFLPALEALLVYAWHRQVAAVLDRRLTRTDAVGSTEAAIATVGFADLVGFTRLSRQMEDVDLAALVERFEAVSADVVAACGAQLVKTVGDEVLFTARDAVTAATAAMRLHEAHRDDPDVPRMRIGLATGPVVHRMGDVFGATVNLASRITAFASPGDTLVDAATARDLAEADACGLRQMPPRRVRGIGVVRTFTVVPYPTAGETPA